MARNEEKAMAMLNRWVRMKRELNTIPRQKRPRNPSLLKSVPECEKWRKDLIEEIVKKVSDIQNASLGEHRIRDLNDEINRLIKSKSNYEARIKELGGPDYKLTAPKALDHEGAELPGSAGYRYFGAAKHLPKVRELFTKEVPTAPKRGRSELYKRITYDYYGLGLGRDVHLRAIEFKHEQINRKKAVEEWEEKLKDHPLKIIKLSANPSDPEEEGSGDDEQDLKKFMEVHEHSKVLQSEQSGRSTEDEIKQILLKKKKETLMNIYASSNLQEMQNETQSIIAS